jgi:hypothetical protein
VLLVFIRFHFSGVLLWVVVQFRSRVSPKFLMRVMFRTLMGPLFVTVLPLIGERLS